MDRRARRTLWGLVVLAAALRFPTLDVQSLWADEAATADVVGRGSLGDLLGAVRDQESTPPLFYVLAWAWTALVGTGEAGLRSLSALAGVATVPLAAAVGARVAGARAGLVAALLVATSPLLVWFSQEARAYALLVLLGAASLLLALRAAEAPTRARLAAWGLAAAAMLATHFFALFVVAGEVVWLALALRRAGTLRPAAAVAALGPPALAGLALLPLALDQREAGRAGFIAQEDLGRRVLQVPKQWLVGYDAPAEVLVTVLAALLVAAALAGLPRWWRGAGHPPGTPVRSAPAGLMALALAAGLLVPLALVATGDDYLVTRNLLAALVPLLVLVATGATGLGGRAGTAVAGALAVLGVVVVVAVAADPGLQREDWRGGVEALGPAQAAGVAVVVVRPGSGRVAVEHYLGAGARRLTAPATVSVVDVLATSGRAGGSRTVPRDGLLTAPPVAGLAEERRAATEAWAVQRFRAGGPGVLVDPAALTGAAPGSAVLVRPGVDTVSGR